LDNNAKLAAAIAKVLTSGDAGRRIDEDMGGAVNFYNHEGEDEHIDFDFDGKGYRLEVQGPFDLE
jgi:hypothetical protein